MQICASTTSSSRPLADGHADRRLLSARTPVRTDTSELTGCGNVIDELADRLGGVDVFVNNAGTGSSTLALDWRSG
jgi:NAD(P)-dependent dehydrogenase (short-subunit alcohol dehydrogenase family)